MFGISSLLLPVALLALSIGAVVRAVGFRKLGIDKPACGRCGYLIADLGQGVCPECGGHLAEVGVLTRQCMLRMRGSYFGLIIGWSALFLILTFVGYFVVGPDSYVASSIGVSRVWQYQNRTSLSREPDWDPATGRTAETARYSIQIRADYVKSEDGYAAGQTVFSLADSESGQNNTIEVDLGTQEIRIQFGLGDQRLRHEKIALVDAADFIRRGQPTVTEKQLAEDSETLKNLIDESVTNGSDITIANRRTRDGRTVFADGGGSLSSMPAPVFSRKFGILPSAYFYGTLGVTELIAYLLSLFSLICRRRRLLNPVTAT